MSTQHSQHGRGPGPPSKGSRAASLLACAAIAATGLAAGCGGDDEEPAAAGSASDEAAMTDEVEIAEFLYAPEAITVDAGTKVTWTNADKAPHTATADDSSFDTGTLKQGDSASASFDVPGTYAYYCRFHAFMKGTVEVR